MTELATVPERPQAIDAAAPEPLLDAAYFERTWRAAQAFSSSTLVPDHFRNTPDNPGGTANAFVVLDWAFRVKVNPLAMLQNTYVVHGRPAIQTTLAIALAERAGVFVDGIAYELTGDGPTRACRATATIARSGRDVATTVSMEMARRDGWVDRKGSKWQSLPDLMLQYRAALWLIRLHAPQVLMGISAVDEISEPAPVEPKPTQLDQLADKLAAPVAKPEAAPAAAVAAPVTPPELPVDTIDENGTEASTEAPGAGMAADPEAEPAGMDDATGGSAPAGSDFSAVAKEWATRIRRLWSTTSLSAIIEALDGAPEPLTMSEIGHLKRAAFDRMEWVEERRRAKAEADARIGEVLDKATPEAAAEPETEAAEAAPVKLMNDWRDPDPDRPPY